MTMLKNNNNTDNNSFQLSSIKETQIFAHKTIIKFVFHISARQMDNRPIHPSSAACSVVENNKSLENSARERSNWIHGLLVRFVDISIK